MTTQLELSAVKRAWIDDALDWFERSHVILVKPFSVESFHNYLPPPPPHENWYGCVIASLRRRGRIREVGRVKSTRPERNGAKVTIWIGV